MTEYDQTSSVSVTPCTAALLNAYGSNMYAAGGLAAKRKIASWVDEEVAGLGLLDSTREYLVKGILEEHWR